jgi:alpha-galactosidase
VTPAARLVLGLMLALPAVPSSAQKYAELARTPPMGWNSWNHYGCEIDEGLIRRTADAMVASGMRDAGYLYVNIDDCWQGERDSDGFLQPDPRRFPSGIRALADYVHARGLKLGLYSDAGAKTCAGRTGSQGHEYQDALQFARWGVDYLKYDWCNTGTGTAQRNPKEAYATMRDALYAAGRPIVFSICEWGENRPWEWAGEIGHLWRTTGDITNCWNCELGHGSWSSFGILSILDKQAGLRKHAGPGRWNDPDMLEVGNLPTLAENRSHFALWAMLAAPLIAGTDVVGMKPEIAAILTNPRIVAIDQDPLGLQGFAWIRSPELEIWARPLSGDRWALAVLNRSDAPRTQTIDFAEHPLSDDLNQKYARIGERHYDIRDEWTGRPRGTTRERLQASVGARDTAVFLLTPIG